MKALIRLLALALMLGSCATPSREPILADDNDVLFAGVRGSVRLSKHRPTDYGKTTAYLDFTIERADATSDETVNAGDSIRLDSQTINGPRNYTLETELTLGSITARFTHIEQMVRFDGSVGIAFVNTDFYLNAGGGLTDSESNTRFGPKLEARFAFEPAPWFNVYALGSLHNAIDFDDPIEIFSTEYGLRFSLNKAALTIGYRNWDYERDYDGSSRSDLELDFAGPVARLEFGF